MYVSRKVCCVLSDSAFSLLLALLSLRIHKTAPGRMASELLVRPSSLMEAIPSSKPGSETSLCDESYEAELVGGTTGTAPDTPLSTTAAYLLFRRPSRTSPFRPSRLRTRTEETIPAKNTSYRNLLSNRSTYSSILPMVSNNSHNNSFRATVGNPNTIPYTMTSENPFDSSKECSTSSTISSLSNDSAHRFHTATGGAPVDSKRPPPQEIYVKLWAEESLDFDDKNEEEDWKCSWVSGGEADEAERDVDAPFDEIIAAQEEKDCAARPPPPPPVSTAVPTPVQTRPKAPKNNIDNNTDSSPHKPLSLQRNNSAPDIPNRSTALLSTYPLVSSRTATGHSPSLHRVNTDTTVTTTTANTANSGRPAIVQRSITLPKPALLGDRPRRKDQKPPPAETVFSFGSRVGQSSMMTPTSATTTTGPMSDLSPRITVPRNQLDRRKKINGVQQDIEFLWKKVASPVRRWAGSDDKVDLQRSKTGCLA